MFNNAGILEEKKPRMIDNKKSDFERVLSVTVTGVFLGIKHVARIMVPARSGCIISTASVCSAIGKIGTHAYTASKHAVVGLTKNAAVELGQYGIRVNCLSPYGVATDMSTTVSGLKREELEKMLDSIANLKGLTTTAEDTANAALYLASDKARYISGHNLFIDGGYTIVDPSIPMFQYPSDS